MTRKRKTPQRAARRPAAPRKPWLPQTQRFLIAGVAAVGFLLTAWLLISRMTSVALPYCTADSACDLVRSSQWSTFLGLPLEAWGLLTYLAIGAIAWFSTRPTRGFRHLWMLSVMAVSVSLYMTWISASRIQALCPYCLVSLGLVIAIFITVSLSRPSHEAHRRGAGWARAGVFALAIGAILHLYYVGLPSRALGDDENPRLAALAEHLDDTGARFYGASWCPNCNRQKAVFGASADRLPYIECSPQGRRGPASRACTAVGVSNYPTWIIDGRRYSRTLTWQELAEFTDFVWEQSPAP